jgi:integral membrane protein (TIGR01906 family)
MARMAATRTVRAPATEVAHTGTSILNALTSVATAIAILGVALLPLLTPLLLHPLLDASTSAAWLQVSPTLVHGLSDRTVSELVFGPGTFAFAGPDGSAFYASAETAHLRDARTLLLVFEALTLASVVFVVWSAVRRKAWAQIRRGATGLTIGIVVIGVVGFFAFEPVFELFHQIFFPGGNWAFDPRSSHMVQLYPFDFWQLTAGTLGLLGLISAAVTWTVARRRSEGARS